MIIKILASVFTGIGGHYLNKRWDKALLFMFLLISGWVFASVYIYFSFQNIIASSEDIAAIAHSSTQKAAVISLLVITLVWLISNIVTIIDTKNNVASNMYHWSKSGIIVAIISSIISSFLIISTIFSSYTVITQQAFSPSEINSTFEYDDTELKSHNFYANIYYGGEPRNSHKLPSPPDGDGILKGQFLFKDKPASGISLSLTLNSQYKAKNIKTDEYGEFSLKLPQGLWVINSIQTDSWDNKPTEGEYSIYDGSEAKLTGSSYNRYAHIDKEGLTVDVVASSGDAHLNYTISKDINLKWPNSTQKINKATIKNTIQWEPYLGAQKYLLAIQKITRDGNTTRYETVVRRIIENSTQLNLSSLKHKKTKNKKNYEYGIEIFAFDKDSTLVSQSTKSFQGGTFMLSDNNVLIEENMNDFFSSANEESPEEFEKKLEAICISDSRLTAAKTLINAQMLQEAQKLLSLVESEYSKGKKEVLLGYISAIQGNCSESKKLFNQAKIINPNVCISIEYLNLCQ